ncbi:MAG: TetR/AcrR family transcriptional regulator [Roseibium album]|uniref:TetR/AcrR family transcriptional regulator n=1 Tax=Roseibium album TaxID=311410 RepID=UPI0032EBC179
MINPDRYLKNTGQEGKFSKGVPVKLSLFQQPGYRGMAPTENELPDRRAQAVQGAFDALKSHGLGELSFDLVASKSGMSRQLVRHYFPDHEALMIAVCDHLARLYSEPLIAAASALDGPERTTVFLDFYFDLLSDNPKPRDDQVYDAMMALAARSNSIRTALADQYGLLGQVLGHEFVVQYPELSQQSASELSFLFVSMMYGHWKMVASLGYSEEHNMVTRRAIDRLIKSYIESPSALSQPIKIWSKQPKL